MVVTLKSGAPEKSRRTYALHGLSHEVNYGVYNNNLQAIERGIKERIFYVDYGKGFELTPKPSPQDYAQSMSAVYSCFQKVVQYVTPLTAIQFAGTYVGRRRTIYEKACAHLIERPIERKDSHIKAFIKAEKYNFTSKINPAPRIIQPRDPRYIVESGRYIKVIEKKIYKQINDLFGATTIFKGLNAHKRGLAMEDHWNAFNNPVAVGLDAKRFDQHVSRAALEYEHSIYKLYYPKDKHFAMLLEWQLVNKGKARCNGGSVSYKVDGCRMSGDVNTALGNCLIMSSLVYVYAQEIGVNIRLANDGDDCVVVMEREHLAQFQGSLHSFFIKHGFFMEVEEPVYTLEAIEFCQSHPVFDGTSYRMVRDPRVAISKDCVSLTPLDNAKIRGMWLAAVGQGGMSLTGGIPVWQDFYARLTELSDGAKPLNDLSMMTGMKILGQGMYHEYKPVTPQARLSFYLAFGITPSEQLCLEGYYRNYEFAADGGSARFVELPLRGSKTT
jgi:hypothetical protein